MRHNLKSHFLVCTECRGAGHVNGQTCGKCRGIGTALIFQGRVLYWGKYFDQSSIVFEKAEKKIRQVFNLFLGVIGLSGIILLAYIGYLDNFTAFFSIKYWFTATTEKLYFWFTLLVDMYLYYRLAMESDVKFSVMARHFRKDDDSAENYLDWQAVWKLKSDHFIDVSWSFTDDSIKAVQAAWELAVHFEHGEVLRLHLFGILPHFDKSAIVLGRLGINFEQFKQKVSHYLSKNVISRGGNPVLSVALRKICILSYIEAYYDDKNKVEMTDIILPLVSHEPSDLKESDPVEEILVDFELNYQKVKNVVAWIRIQELMRHSLHRFKERARYKPKSGIDRAMTGIATPVVNSFGDDLTLKAKFGYLFPCVGREKEFEAIFRIMEASRKGVLLAGNLGVGKTTIIEGLAQRMVIEDVPEILQDKRLVSLDIARLIAGADASLAEERLLAIADEVIRSGNIVLVVDNIHHLSGIGAGGGSSLDLIEVFAQILARHLFYCIATTNPEDYSRAIEKSSLQVEFQVVKVEEMELNSAICVMEAKSGPVEYQNKVYFSYDAIEKAAVLSSKYIHDRYLPEKGIGILEQAGIKVRQERGENKIVSGDDVAQVISEMTNIPVAKVTEKESNKLLNLEKFIHERMIGQEEAVSIVAAALRRARAELREGKRPIASLLFLGPTGVGKTELAKTVAEVYFNNENNMIRVDMSEYQDQASVSRLIGYNSQAGILTEAVRKNPFSLVLFDEVEKAHPDILNLFLQMMDDGRLTDAQGRVVDFTNAIIIMTSNAGAQYIQDEINKGTNIEAIKNYLINEELRHHFRPEFLNRFDGIVVFKPLSMMDVIQITKLMINKIISKLSEKGIAFEVPDETISELAELGFDPKFGARPLRRIIQQKVDDVLANYLLQGSLSPRDKVILEPGGKLNVIKAERI